MRYLWSRFIIIFLMVEVVLFGVYYNFGPRGRLALQQLQQLKSETQQQIETMTAENNDLQDQIESWKTDQFLQEKFAREKLAMQKQGEIIYFR
jgi:cell division protein FtsB